MFVGSRAAKASRRAARAVVCELAPEDPDPASDADAAPVSTPGNSIDPSASARTPLSFGGADSESSSLPDPQSPKDAMDGGCGESNPQYPAEGNTA